MHHHDRHVWMMIEARIAQRTKAASRRELWRLGKAQHVCTTGFAVDASRQVDRHLEIAAHDTTKRVRRRGGRVGVISGPSAAAGGTLDVGGGAAAAARRERAR